MTFEITYTNDLLATCPIAELSAEYLESLFAQYDEEYDLSGSYDEAAEWVTELILIPVYA